jgi:hypothetical protein
MEHGGKPGWALLVWDWESNQTITFVKTWEDETPVTQFSLSPDKNHRIAVTGENILEVYKLENSKLTEEIIPNPKIGNIYCYLWLHDQVLLYANSQEASSPFSPHRPNPPSPSERTWL